MDFQKTPKPVKVRAIPPMDPVPDLLHGRRRGLDSLTAGAFFRPPLRGLYRKSRRLFTMQIPETPLNLIAGILTQPLAGSRPQIDAARQAPALQDKTQAQTPPPSRRPAGGGGLLRLGSAETLDQAVQALRAEGRLPRRGSLLDITA
jgi:hypothetical protein